MEIKDSLFEDQIKLHCEMEISSCLALIEKSRLDPNNVRNTYLRKISDELTALHMHSDLPNIPHDIQFIYESDKTLSYIESMKLCCQQRSLEIGKVFEYEVKRKALQKAFEDIKSEIDDSELPAEDQNIQFTLNRKVLAILYLLKQDDEKSNSGSQVKNQTQVAKFVEFLISKEPNPKGVRNTQLYRVVNNFFGSYHKAPASDLEFIKAQFIKIGMDDIAKKIERRLPPHK